MLNVAAVFSDHMVLQRELPIPVFGEADGPVRISLAGREAQALPENGRFCVALPAMDAGGPYELRVVSGGEERVFSDVMIGEVWLCGGQSNMEFRLNDDADGLDEVATGEDALLRFYTVNEEPRVDEAMLARERQTAWKPLAPGTCGDVSAVAYYAGRRLRAALNVPVGMLICCIGGSEIACWMSREALTSFAEGEVRLRAFEEASAQVSDEAFERADAEYTARVDAWCRAADAVKANHHGIRGCDIARQVGDFPWPPPTGRWMLRRPGGPWETMVCRIAPYAARGLLWYQGETDAGTPEGYAARLSRLVAEWRAAFRNDALCAVVAQLPGYGSDPAAENWPAIRRDQQLVCDSTPGCALVCLLDCGESDDIHPWAKRTPGTRMADAALKAAYGAGDGAQAPRLESVARLADGLVLRFTRPLAPREEGFESLLADGAAARARIEADGALRIDGAGLRAVAYAQQNDPKLCLFGNDGMPALPFEWRAE
ncbi:MAG: hypothetical protein IJ124_04975 [Clostridia bacterium]|nr:hypothetical protein [Clostridia bacterium]